MRLVAGVDLYIFLGTIIYTVTLDGQKAHQFGEQFFWVKRTLVMSFQDRLQEDSFLKKN